METRRFSLAVSVPAAQEAAGRRGPEDRAARSLVHLVRGEGYEVLDGAVEFEWRPWPSGDLWLLVLRAHVILLDPG